MCTYSRAVKSLLTPAWGWEGESWGERRMEVVGGHLCVSATGLCSMYLVRGGCGRATLEFQNSVWETAELGVLPPADQLQDLLDLTHLLTSPSRASVRHVWGIILEPKGPICNDVNFNFYL